MYMYTPHDSYGSVRTLHFITKRPDGSLLLKRPDGRRTRTSHAPLAPSKQPLSIMSEPPMAPIFNVRRHTGSDFESGAVHRARGINEAVPGVDVVDGREEERSWAGGTATTRTMSRMC